MGQEVTGCPTTYFVSSDLGVHSDVRGIGLTREGVARPTAAPRVPFATEGAGQWLRPVPNSGEVELENISDGPLEIAFQMTELQYLNLTVAASDGRIVSEGHFGDRFAPTLDPRVLRLGPGEKFTAPVSLFVAVHGRPIPAGTYAIQAVYEYGHFRAISNVVELAVTNEATSNPTP